MRELTAGSMTLAKLRQLYRDTWGRDWPENDSYLRELWAEARQSQINGTNRVPPPAVFDRCLEAMRENHPFLVPAQSASDEEDEPEPEKEEMDLEAARLDAIRYEQDYERGSCDA